MSIARDAVARRRRAAPTAAASSVGSTPRALERGDDVAADEAGGAGDRDLHGTHLSAGTAVTKRPPQPRT